MLTFKYNGEKVESQSRQNTADLVRAFSRYDFYSQDERTEHLHSSYIPKIVGIASHLGALAEQDDKLRDVRVLEMRFRKFCRFDDFDPRYSSEYSAKWSEKPDIYSEINQQL